MRLLSILALLLLAPAASAQLAIGGQVGDPTGLSLKFGAGSGALLLGVGWDLDESVSAEGHYVLSARRVNGARSDVRLFYGPGAFVQSYDGVYPSSAPASASGWRPCSRTTSRSTGSSRPASNSSRRPTSTWAAGSACASGCRLWP